jgi:electron transport complex protein RnfC
MWLEPFLLVRLARSGDTESLESNAVQDCIMCGCCLYSCPAGIPLLDEISSARGQVLGIMKARAAAAKAAAEAVKAKTE